MNIIVLNIGAHICMTIDVIKEEKQYILVRRLGVPHLDRIDYHSSFASVFCIL